MFTYCWVYNLLEAWLSKTLNAWVIHPNIFHMLLTRQIDYVPIRFLQVCSCFFVISENELLTIEFDSMLWRRMWILFYRTEDILHEDRPYSFLSTSTLVYLSTESFDDISRRKYLYTRHLQPCSKYISSIFIITGS